MTAVFVRIALRYAAGMLVTYGILAPGDVGVILDDPALERDIAMLVGALVGIAVEGAYALARRMGWRT